MYTFQLEEEEEEEEKTRVILGVRELVGTAILYLILDMDPDLTPSLQFVWPGDQI